MCRLCPVVYLVESTPKSPWGSTSMDVTLEARRLPLAPMCDSFNAPKTDPHSGVTHLAYTGCPLVDHRRQQTAFC